VLISRDRLHEHGLDRITSVFSPFRFEPPVELQGVSIGTEVSVGQHSYMNNGYIRDRTSIGRFCSIGRNVAIAAGDHPLDCLTTHPIAWKTRRHPGRPVWSTRAKKHPTTELGNDVWIGDNVVVLSGIHIGTGAAIGANGVVTKDVPPYVVAGGVPARFIKLRFNEEIVARLLASEWWLLPEEAVRTLDVTNIEECLELIPRLKEQFGIVPIKYTEITA
jgi:virginiamycin A acetyltransferase